MAEEHQGEPRSFCIQQQFEKGPLHLLHSYRISQLQNKAIFFQGQVDPLLGQNISLKDQLVHLSKLVISSTDILRNLLPNSQHPSKKLQLQMASIEQIAKLIQNDWHAMESNLDSYRQQIIKLTEQKINWRSLYQIQKEERAKQVKKLHDRLDENKNAYEMSLAGLHLQMTQLQQLHELQKKQIHADFADKMKIYEIKEREYELFRRQAKIKEEQFEKKITRLKEEIDANQVSFEEAKKNIKLIYEKLMNDKLSEQAENFEMLLKMKEQEKIEVLMLMSEAQEQYKRKAAQKEYEITKLTQRNDRYSEQVGALKNDIWKKQLQLDRQFEQARARQEQIMKLEQDKIDLGRQLVKKDQEYVLEKQQLGQVIKSKEKEISMLLAQGKESIQKILAQKQSLEKQLHQNNQKLAEAELALQKNNSKWQKKINIMKKEWALQAEKLKAQLDEQRQLKEKWFQMHQQSQKQKSLTQIEFAEKLKRIEETHREQQYVLQSKYGAQISKMKERHEQQLSQISLKHQQQISDILFNSNEEMRQLVSNCNKKIAQQQAEFILQKNQMEKQRIAMEQQAKELEKRLNKAKGALQEQQQKHLEVIKQLAEQAQLQRQKLQQRMIQQRRQFEDEMQKQEARLIQIKASMEKEIRLLKQSNAITSIENKFMNQINKLKEQFAQRIRQNNEACQKEIGQLNQAHQDQVHTLKEGFNIDLNQIVQNIQQKSSMLNERLIHEFNDSELMGLNEQEKKEFIIRKVEEIKKSNEQKENKIIEIEYALDQAEKTVEKRVRARKQQLQRQKQILAKQCIRKIQSITSDCKAKIAQVQRQRIQYSQQMYLQFQSLREKHRNEMENLKKKYIQLQMIFEERPSRMEDLTKIKELMNMQTKLDIEIQGYHKKMETANEIVKYLNLQLENYKDTYDIFGANGEGIQGIVGMSAVKHSGHGNPHSETNHILEVIKEHRHASQAKILTQERRQLKEVLPFRRFNDTASPAIKEVKLFQDDQSEHSAIISRDYSEGKEKQKEKEKKYSYLMVERGLQRRRRLKTEKNEHEAQIMINAENFIKLIKGGLQDAPPVIKEVSQQRRKSYRKRKLHKRQPTVGFDQYF